MIKSNYWILFLLFTAAIINNGNLFGQNPEWMNFANGNYILEITSDADTMWVGTGGGLVKIVTTTGATSFYDKLNSGLSDNCITAITFAPDGRKWIGTYEGGLNIWDGVNWIVYDTSNSPLISNYIVAIDFDSSGVAYVATDWNICKSNYDSIWSFGEISYISCMQIDDQGKVWVGSRNSLHCFNGIEWEDIAITSMWDHITSIAIDDQGVKWLSTSGGLYKYNDITVVKYGPSQMSMAQSVKIDTEGNKWVGSYNAVGKFNGTSWEFFYPTQNGFPENHVNAIEIDAQNNKWVGTWRGLAMFNNSPWNLYNTSNSDIPENYIKTIKIDKSGNKWMGSWDNAALIKFNNNEWSLFNPDLGTILIDELVIDLDGKKWISDRHNGVFVYDDTTWVSYNTINSGLPDDAVRSLFADKDNNIWIGTLNGGLAKFDQYQSEWTILNTSNNCMESDWVDNIFIDDTGSTWLVADGNGVVKFNESGCENFNSSNSGIVQGFVEKITSDSNGKMWFGTQDGISSFDGTNWNSYFLGTPGYSYYMINDVAADKEGNIWVGSDGTGLYKFDGTEWTNYNIINSGICCNYVMSIAIDSLGTKWIGTWNGLSLFNEQGIVLSNKSFAVNNNNILKLYPNPAKETLKVSLPNDKKTSQIQIVNINGISVRNLPSTGTETNIDISDLQPGVYLIRAQGSDAVKVGKFVKVK